MPRGRSGDSRAEREMGPTLRLTPLSPACGLRRALYAWRLDAGSDRPLRTTEGRLRYRPALAPVPGPSGAEQATRTCPYRPAAPRLVSSAWASNGARLPEGAANASAPGRQFRPVRLCALAASTVWDLVCPRTNLWTFRFTSLHRAASRRRVEAVPKSLPSRRPFGLCLGRANPRFDMWKVRRAADSGKRG